MIRFATVKIMHDKGSVFHTMPVEYMVWKESEKWIRKGLDCGGSTAARDLLNGRDMRLMSFRRKEKNMKFKTSC